MLLRNSLVLMKIRVLHIIKDDKFFDSVMEAFMQDDRFENRAVLFVDAENYSYRRIQHSELVDLLWSDQMIKERLASGTYDVLFFHSIMTQYWKYFKYIPKNIIVIWWCWGFELYHKVHGMSPILQIDLYKPKTSVLIKSFQSRMDKVKDFVKDHFAKYYWYLQRDKVLSRVDYFQPVIPMEYNMMKSLKGFHAKEYYYPNCFNVYQNISAINPVDPNGSILIGNSASETNNHIDIWHTIKSYIQTERTIIIPLSYGHEYYADAVEKEIKKDGRKVITLRQFMPRDEYFTLINSCSYAIFGVMRQQAMGNIYYALSHGLKLFIYKDSMVYKFLQESGYVVFAIEDVDESSFQIPLTMEQQTQNKKAFSREYMYIEDTREKAILEISNIVSQ